MAKAKAAGQFLGGILNNPFVALLLLGVGALLIFREPILKGFSSIGESFGNIDINLPEFNFPDFNFPDIKFPDFNFPDFNFPDIKFPDFNLGGFEGDPDESLVEKGLVDPIIDPETGETRIDVIPDTTGGRADQQRKVRDFFKEKFGEAAEPFRDAEIFAKDFPEEFIERPAQGFAVPNIPTPPPVKSFLIDEPTQKFEGGGISFVSGSIFETPIANLSLSQIIDKFMVTASQAADIRAQAIGFSPEEELFLAGSGDIGGFSTGFNPPAVSSSEFEGLTAEEIALRLTGGNISNF